MPTRILSSLALRKRAWAVVLVTSALLAVVGGAVLLGWARDVEWLKRPAPGLVSMKPNAAVGLLLAAAALVLRSSASRWARRIGHVPALLVAVLGGLTLAEYLAAWDPGLDQRLFREAADTPGTSHPGRMAPNSALGFLLAGLALSLVGSARKWIHQVGELMAFVVGIVAFQALVGYAFGVVALYGLPEATQMALHSAVAFLILTVGILFVAPDRGYMSVVVEPGGAGVAARVLLPIAVMMPFLLGLFVVAGARADLYGDRLGISILVSLLTLFILAAVGWTAGEIREVDRQRLELLEREQEARSRMERTLREREELLSVVSHDLRNPLNTISATASLLLEGVVPPGEEERHLRAVKRAAGTMERLISDLLDVARIERGRLSVSRRRTDISRLLRDCCEELRHVARENGVTLRWEVDDLPAVDVDPERIRQVLGNLVGNAIRFTPEGGNVTVEAQEAYGKVRVRVTDTGPGIGDGELPHLFDAFWQGERRASQGAGLGLAIVRGLVEAHGGEVWATSPPGSGAVFWFTLPVPHEKERPSSEPAEPAEGAEPAERVEAGEAAEPVEESMGDTPTPPVRG